jgi:hypothetical protein
VQQIEEDDADCGHYVDREIPMLHCGFDVSRLQQLNSDDDEHAGECCGGESFSGCASAGRIGVVSTSRARSRQIPAVIVRANSRRLLSVLKHFPALIPDFFMAASVGSDVLASLMPNHA